MLQIGAGGAGSAIAIALLDAGVRELVLHDTNPSRMDEIVPLLAGLCRGRAIAGPPDPTGFQLVLNATALGMSSGDTLPVEAHLLSSSMFVGDVVAGHGVTPLLQAAQAMGCRTVDGAAMVECGVDLMAEFLIGG